MLSICLRYAKDMDLAKDMMNEGFMKIFSNIKKYDGKGSFEGWMKRIMVNNAIDILRKEKKHINNISSDEHYVEDKETDVNYGLENLKQQDLLNLFNELAPKTRLAFGMYVIDGFKHKEIAEQLDMSEETSKWHIKEARKYLKERIIELKLI